MKQIAVAIAILAAACGGSDSNHNGDDDDGGSNGSGSGSGSNMAAVCGDGVVDVATEQCDDGNTTNGDGCSSTCKIEVVNKCGNGQLDTGETCDDGNTADNDGCNHSCAVEMGYTCTGTPSVCTMMSTGTGSCAAPFALALTMSGTAYNASAMADTTMSTDQFVEASCDGSTSGGGNDHQYTFVNPVAQPVVITLNTNVDPDLAWDGEIRLTTTACDNTTAIPDDGPDAADNDGCADQHFSIPEQLEYTMLPAGTYYIDIDGYDDSESGPYSLTIFAGMATCGNGVVEPGEDCDDHNTADMDGCSSTCTVEAGYACTGSPSVCTVTCGNGVIDDGEDCDDMNTANGDGCSATCLVESGWDCGFDEPSVCTFVCGDGVIDDSEACDDGNTTANDGCSATCQIETGYVCSGEPSVCKVPLCGDHVLDPDEQCDVANDAHCNATTCKIIFNTTEVTTANDDGAHAQLIQPVSQWISGGLTAGDIDVYKFTLTAAASVTLETFDQYDPTRASSSESMGHLFCAPEAGTTLDTQIRIFDDPTAVSDNSMSIAYDDDGGDSVCSYIPATEAMLTAGTYYVKINQYHATAVNPLYGIQMTVTP